MGALDRSAAIFTIGFGECPQLWVSSRGGQDHLSVSVAALKSKGYGGAILDVSRGLWRGHH